MKYIDLILEFGLWFIPFVILFTIVVNLQNSKGLDDFLRKYVFSIIVFVPMIITWGDLEFCFGLTTVHLLSTILSLYDSDTKIFEIEKIRASKAFKLTPAQIVLFSFSFLILVGALLLKIPISRTEGHPISFVDAIFMSTSATCVTGLSTMSLSENFSFFGQMVILALIQIGGLGIMTLTSSMVILLGKAMPMKDRVIMQDLLDVSSLEQLLALIVDIIRYTFIIELWGAVVLTIAFIFEGFEFVDALYYGFFHSVSAFCNAGFALFNNSLENYATNPFINGTIAILITLGGLGFIVLRELKEIVTKGKSWVRITFHTKIVLTTSTLLIIGGALFIFFGEFLHALDAYSLWEKVQISLFQSVTLRTAGFNTISLTNLNTYTICGMCLFMFIGGSPGSTSGGIKTTSLAILFQSVKSTLKGHKKVVIFDRSVPSHLVVRVTAITFIYILAISFFILVIMKIEPKQSFLTIFFEVISASGTVGLSLGITPYLSVLGKIAISILMLIGRIGPLTLVLAIGAQRPEATGKIEHPEGRLMIG